MSNNCGDCRKREHQDRVRASIPRPFGDCAAPGCEGRVEYQAFWPLCMTHAGKILDSYKRAEEWSLNLARTMSSQSEDDRASRTDEHDTEIRAGAAGFVYYLRVGERVKIGFSVDIRQRMRAYPHGSTLLAVEPGSYELERQRHQQFANARQSGREWFRPCPEIDAHCAALVEQHGSPSRFEYRFREQNAPAGGPTPRRRKGRRYSP